MENIFTTPLTRFKKAVLNGIVKGASGKPLTEESWSGFAEVTREGGTIFYSASLKEPIIGDPKDVKAAFQKQPLSGFTLQSVEAIMALFQDQLISRTQLIFKRVTL